MSERRLRKQQQRRERILGVAYDIVVEVGPHDFSLHEVARRLDYATATLYHYFESREALLVAVQIRAIETLLELFDASRHRAREEAAHKTEDARVRVLYELAHVLEFYMDLQDQRPDLSQIVSFSLDPQFWLDRKYDAVLMTPILRLLSSVAESMSEAQRIGALSPGHPLQRAIAAWSAAQGFVQVSKLTRLSSETFPMREISRDYAKAVLRGWGAEPTDVEQAYNLLLA